MIKFLSRTVRVKTMGGKFVVELKEKSFTEDGEGPATDSSDLKVFDTAEDAETAVWEFMANG